MNTIDLYEAMSTLRAVRRLKKDPIPDAVLDRVLTAATWAPTGGNAQPFRMLVVQNHDKKQVLGNLYAERWAQFAGMYRARLTGLPEAQLLAQERIIASGDYLATHFADCPCIIVFCFNPKAMAITDRKLDRVSVVGGGSVYPAVQNLLLACRKEGLGCVLTTLLCECEEQVRELLGIPDPWGTAAAIPIGYPIGKGHGPITRQGIGQLVNLDSWGNPLRAN
jgi:nitroreductase